MLIASAAHSNDASYSLIDYTALIFSMKQTNFNIYYNLQNFLKFEFIKIMNAEYEDILYKI